MESPLNPEIFRTLFHLTFGGLTVAAIFSIYHQKYDMENIMGSHFARLQAAKSNDDKEKILAEIVGRIQADAAKKNTGSRLSAVKYGKHLVSLLKLEKDGSNADLVSTTLKVVLRVYGADPASRDRLEEFGGYKALLATLSESYRQGNGDLMEEVAETLKTLTEVNDDELLTAEDVPEGTKGAFALATAPAIVKMLRILDGDSPILFLNALTGIFCNLTMFQPGAVNIGKGADGHDGISYFFALLDHSNRSVVANCTRVIRYLARAHMGREELSKRENVQRLADHFTPNGEVVVLNSVMTVLLIMAVSTEMHGEAFYKNVCETNIITNLFELFVRHSDRGVRERAETVCSVLERIPYTAEKTKGLFESYRAQINERRGKDKEEYQKQMQQMQQQQMMQRMMFEQMGIDPSMMMGA